MQLEDLEVILKRPPKCSVVQEEWKKLLKN